MNYLINIGIHSWSSLSFFNTSFAN